MADRKKISGAGTMSLTWTRSDLPFEQCFEYWRGPHGQLVGHNTSCFSYRQLHFDRVTPLLNIPQWRLPQDCPGEWIPDGIAECMCTNLLRAAMSQHTKIAKFTFKDEQNAFERTLLYTAMPGNARFDVERASEYALNGIARGKRVVLLFKQKSDAGGKLKDFIQNKLVPVLENDPKVTELHSYVFAPYDENAWPGENIRHDHPSELQYGAGLVIAAGDENTLLSVLSGTEVSDCINSGVSLLEFVHIFNIRFAYVMRYNNKSTIAAVRGAQVCDVLMAAKAENQVSDEFISYLFRSF